MEEQTAPCGLELSLVEGGALHRLLHRNGRSRGSAALLRVGLALGVMVWLPLLLVSVAEGAALGERGSFAMDVGIHARLLLALPLAIWAERPIADRLARALRYLGQAGLVDEGNRRAAHAVVDRARRLLDLRGLDVVLAIGALALSALDVARGPQEISTWSLSHHQGDLRVSLAGWVYLLVGAPLVRFVALRWIWRFLVWSALLVGLARAKLRIDPAHPDGSGGLSVVFSAQTSFGWLALAASVALAGNLWTETIILERSVLAYWHLAATFAVFAPLALLAPLFVFSAPLERARQHFHEGYGAASADFAARYARQWIVEGTRSALPLGTGETSAHADLVTSFDRVARVHWVPFSKADYLLLFAAAVAPLLVFMMHELPLLEVLVRIKGTTGVGG